MPLPPLRPPGSLAPRVPFVPGPLAAARLTQLPPAQRLEAAVAELHALRAQMNRWVYRVGTLLRVLSDPLVLAVAGMPDFGALLEHYDLPSRVSAQKYMAVAESFTEEEAAQLGVERGFAVVRGAAALPEPIAPRALLAKNPVIDTGLGAHRLAVAPFRALEAWLGTLGTPAPQPTKKAFKEADSVRDKLHRRFAAAGIGAAKMRLTRRGGAYVVRVELTPEEAAALAALVKASPRKTS